MSTTVLLLEQLPHLVDAAGAAQSVAHAAAPVLVHTGPASAVQAGILDTATQKATDLQEFLKVAGGVAATLIALITGWRARGALAGMLTGAAVAALYAYVVYNVADPGIREQIDNELNSQGAVVVEQSLQHDLAGPAEVRDAPQPQAGADRWA